MRETGGKGAEPHQSPHLPMPPLAQVSCCDRSLYALRTETKNAWGTGLFLRSPDCKAERGMAITWTSSAKRHLRQHPVARVRVGGELFSVSHRASEAVAAVWLAARDAPPRVFHPAAATAP